ncbi:MAG: acyl-ACP thioesterase family protein [Clostridiales bacterium]|jgi:acyl-ACP thioesterase|nr:acyl-ACP thioesterase family protein [Clostridiales bacterium]
MANFTFEKFYEVTYRDADPKQECKLESYLDFMADCGMNNEKAFGFPINGENGLRESSWVFFDYEVKIYEKAKLGQYLKVVTIIDDLTKYYATRKFLIFNNNGKLIAESKVLAFLIDTKRRRPIMVPDIYFQVYGINQDKKTKQLQRLSIPEIETIDSEKVFEPSYGSIDVNYHVGNTTYLQWALDTMPLNIVEEYTVFEIKMQFEKEINYGTKIKVSSQIKGDGDKIQAIHKITNLDDDKLAIIETSWTKSFFS